jgi:peptidyl-prolyl cis-trans isomerase C
VLLIFSCSKKEDGKVLVTIDGEKITLNEFNNALDKIPMNMKMLVATESGKRTYLDNFITKRLLLREAKKEKMDSDKEFLERLGEIRDQLLMESLLKKKLTLEGKVTDEDLKQYYASHKEEFKKEGEINTRHILLKTEDEAKQILVRLQKGEDFIELAKRYSIDPNAKASGGEIGFHPRGSLLPEYEAQALKLKKIGQISGIVKTKFGYHIIQLEGIKPSAYVPFDEVKEFAKQQMGQEKQKELFEQYVQDLKKSSKITINELLLKTEDKPKATSPSEKPETKLEETAGPQNEETKPVAKEDNQAEQKKDAAKSEGKQEKSAVKEEGQLKK